MWITVPESPIILLNQHFLDHRPTPKRLACCPVSVNQIARQKSDPVFYNPSAQKKKYHQIPASNSIRSKCGWYGIVRCWYAHSIERPSNEFLWLMRPGVHQQHFHTQTTERAVRRPHRPTASQQDVFLIQLLDQPSRQTVLKHCFEKRINARQISVVRFSIMHAEILVPFEHHAVSIK